MRLLALLVRSIDHETGCDIDCRDLLTLAGVILSCVEVEATHHVPTKLVLLALLMLGAGIVWLVVEISRTPNDR